MVSVIRGLEEGLFYFGTVGAPSLFSALSLHFKFVTKLWNFGSYSGLKHEEK